MSVLTASLFFIAAFLSGVVNAVAGGGTFITFGAMTLGGVPPISANATSSLTQFPGYVTSTLAYWTDIKTIWRKAPVLMLVSALGAVGGSLILLSLDNPSFRALVPWLLIAATALFAAGPWLKPGSKQAANDNPSNPIAGPIVQFLTSIYGGFFGAGLGIMMLATLGLTEKGDYHRLNALKNLLSIVIAAVAIVIFTLGGVVSWLHVLVMVPGVALGGYVGVWTAKRLPQIVVRLFVIAVGLLLAAYYFAFA
ncbi:sulfite exporter TauE/SafE family protein [Chelativorans sp.]|uniref:sulfite exporter TauE/SafE family protein n=1 Tax=Chelativorans sp. TaxID=2203393 RepID=UPI0028114919|nr:sulfite exporter TauE/SafE family protein [Chelativorans sp.]